MEARLELWTWQWVGGGREWTLAADHTSARQIAVDLGRLWGMRGTVLLPDLATLKVFEDSKESRAISTLKW